jgi:four helix bundle protein
MTDELEERTLRFAREVIGLVNSLSMTMANTETAKQVIRSSGSIGAGYIAASETIDKEDSKKTLNNCRKEARETRYWLRLVEVHNTETEAKTRWLIKESEELARIFSTIIGNTGSEEL